MIEKKKPGTKGQKVSQLNLKSKDYNQGTALNRPLSVEEFEGNFTTLADAINSNSVDINTLVSDTSDLGKTIKEGEKELAVLKGRVDGSEAKIGELENAVQELGAILPSIDEVELAKTKQAFEDAVNIQIAVDSFNNSPSVVANTINRDEIFERVKLALQQSTALISEVEQSKLPLDYLKELLNNNFNCTFEMLEDYLATTPEIVEVEYDGTKEDQISDEIVMIVDTKGYFIGGIGVEYDDAGNIIGLSESNVEWSLGWDFESIPVDERDWTTDLSNLIKNPDAEILKAELVFRFLNSSESDSATPEYAVPSPNVKDPKDTGYADDSYYTYYRTVVKSKSNIRNNRVSASAASDDVSEDIIYPQYTYLRQEVDPFKESSYSIAAEYLKYLVTTDRVFTKSTKYFLDSYIIKSESKLPDSISKVLDYLEPYSSKDGGDLVLEEVLISVFGTKGLELVFEVNEAGDTWTWKIDTIIKLKEAISLADNLQKSQEYFEKIFSSYFKFGKISESDLVKEFVQTMLKYGFVVPAEVLDGGSNYGYGYGYGYESGAIAEQCFNFYSAIIKFIEIFSRYGKFDVVDGLAFKWYNSYGTHGSLTIGSDTFQLLQELISKFDGKTPNQIFEYVGVLLKLDSRYEEFIIKSGIIAPIYDFISENYSQIIKIGTDFDQFKEMYTNAILKFGQFIVVGLEDSYTLLNGPWPWDWIFRKHNYKANVECWCGVVHVSFGSGTTQFVDNPYWYDVLVENWGKEVVKFYNNMPISLDIAEKVSILEGIENIIDNAYRQEQNQAVTDFYNSSLLSSLFGGDYSIVSGLAYDDIDSLMNESANWIIGENGIVFTDSKLGSREFDNWYQRIIGSVNDIHNRRSAFGYSYLQDYLNYFWTTYRPNVLNVAPGQFTNPSNWFEGLYVNFERFLFDTFGTTDIPEDAEEIYTRSGSLDFNVAPIYLSPSMLSTALSNLGSTEVEINTAIENLLKEYVAKSMFSGIIKGRHYYDMRWAALAATQGVSYELIGDYWHYTINRTSNWWQNDGYESNWTNDNSNKAMFTRIFGATSSVDTSNELASKVVTFEEDYWKLRDTLYTKGMDFYGEVIWVFDGVDEYPRFGKESFGITSVFQVYEIIKANFPETSTNKKYWTALKALYKAVCDQLDVTYDKPQEQNDKSYFAISVNNKNYLLNLYNDYRVPHDFINNPSLINSEWSFDQLRWAFRMTLDYLIGRKNEEANF
jgi:hypothetical protein